MLSVSFRLQWLSILKKNAGFWVVLNARYFGILKLLYDRGHKYACLLRLAHVARFERISNGYLLYVSRQSAGCHCSCDC